MNTDKWVGSIRRPILCGRRRSGLEAEQADAFNAGCARQEIRRLISADIGDLERQCDPTHRGSVGISRSSLDELTKKIRRAREENTRVEVSADGEILNYCHAQA